MDKVKAKVKVDSNRKMVKDKGTLVEDKVEEVELMQVDETKVTEEDELVERGKEVVKLNKSNRKLQKASSIIILKI